MNFDEDKPPQSRFNAKVKSPSIKAPCNRKKVSHLIFFMHALHIKGLIINLHRSHCWHVKDKKANKQTAA